VVAVGAQVCFGENVTDNVQLKPAASGDGQLLLSGKSLPSLPFTRIFEILRAAVPVLVNLTCCAGLVVPTFCAAKVRADGESSTTVPAPLNSTTCGFDEALSLIEISPTLDPTLGGVKVTVSVQCPCGARAVPQVSLRLNGPEWVIDDIFNAAALLLVSVTFWGALVVPTSCCGKFSGVMGEKLTTPVFSHVTTPL